VKEQLLLGAADALGFWPPPEQVEAALDKAAAEHPLLFLVGHTALSADGRYQPDPASDEDRRAVQLTRQFSQDTAARVAVTGSVIEILRNEGHWSSEAMTAAARLVDEPLAAACEEGLEALETGRGWRAIHCLVPQLERAVRLVGLEIGANVMRRATRGGLRWASLEELLGDKTIAAALQPRLAVGLSRLFVDPYGPNYRNEVAHGAADPGGEYTGASTLTALAILSVAVRLAIARERTAAQAPGGGRAAGAARTGSKGVGSRGGRMKGQCHFTRAVAVKIRWLLDRTRAASRADQKVLRQEIRDLGFYISDFSRPATGFRRRDFEDLVRTGQIEVI
jgi:hypothetical protein